MSTRSRKTGKMPRGPRAHTQRSATSDREPAIEPDIERAAVVSALRKLESLGVKFVLTPHGNFHHPLNIQLHTREAADMLDHPDRVLAELLGFTRTSELIEWQENDGAIRCRGRTEQGAQCTNPVPGLVDLDPHDWLYYERHGGGFCPLHRDE